LARHTEPEREVQRQIAAGGLVRVAGTVRLSERHVLAEPGKRLLQAGAAAQVEQRPLPRMGRRLLQPLQRRRNANAVKRKGRTRRSERHREHDNHHG